MKYAQVLGVMLLSLASGYFFTVTSVSFPFKVISYFFLLWHSVSSLFAAMDNLLLSVRSRLLIFAVKILRILTPEFIGASAMASWLLVNLNLLILGPLLILLVAPI